MSSKSLEFLWLSSSTSIQKILIHKKELLIRLKEVLNKEEKTNEESDVKMILDGFAKRFKPKLTKAPVHMKEK